MDPVSLNKKIEERAKKKWRNISLEAETAILKAHEKKLSLREIADLLKSEGVQASHMTVKRIIEANTPNE